MKRIYFFYLLHATRMILLQSTLVGSSRSWLVEFYSSWCGHCVHYAPAFKKLAKDVYGREHHFVEYW